MVTFVMVPCQQVTSWIGALVGLLSLWLVTWGQIRHISIVRLVTHECWAHRDVDWVEHMETWSGWNAWSVVERMGT